jgi:hypothetical protein
MTDRERPSDVAAYLAQLQAVSPDVDDLTMFLIAARYSPDPVVRGTTVMALPECARWFDNPPMH